MIYAELLSKKFADFLAVDSVSLEVKAGQVAILLGPNGAGKTTTVRMLTSLLRPTSGQALVAGYDVVKQPEQVRARVGVLTEHHGLYNRMNAEEYLQFFGELYGMAPPVIHERSRQWLEHFGLYDDRHRRLGEFSKGMRQKLALVRALLHDPQVLLLDEPTSAMDPESSRMVRNAIHSLRSGERTILICTHNLAEAEELADQVVIIRRGRVLLSGSPAELKQKLLGAAEYEARFAANPNGWKVDALPGVALSASGENWLRFRVDDPEQNNPRLLRSLVQSNLGVISFQEMPRSLEQAYLEAIKQ